MPGRPRPQALPRRAHSWQAGDGEWVTLDEFRATAHSGSYCALLGCDSWQARAGCFNIEDARCSMQHQTGVAGCCVFAGQLAGVWHNANSCLGRHLQRG